MTACLLHEWSRTGSNSTQRHEWLDMLKLPIWKRCAQGHQEFTLWNWTPPPLCIKFPKSVSCSQSRRSLSSSWCWPHCLGLVGLRPRQFKTPDKWGDSSQKLWGLWCRRTSCRQLFSTIPQSAAPLFESMVCTCNLCTDRTCSHKVALLIQLHSSRMSDKLLQVQLDDRQLLIVSCVYLSVFFHSECDYLFANWMTNLHMTSTLR